jgi:hypothetical protein
MKHMIRPEGLEGGLDHHNTEQGASVGAEADLRFLTELGDVEQLPDGTYQHTPLVIKDREAAMKFGRTVEAIIKKLDAGQYTSAEAERRWARAYRRARDESAMRTSGIVVVRR